jgi:hypothetical protein
MPRYLKEAEAKFTMVCLPLNRIEKFKRDFPYARPVQDVLDTAYATLKAGLTEAERAALAIHDSSRYHAGGSGTAHDNLRNLAANRIDDPELRAAVDSATVDIRKFTERRKALGFGPEYKPYKSPLDQYPLYQAIQAQHPHTYLYFNAVYAARQETA